MLRDLLGDGLDVVQFPHEVVAVDQLTVDVIPAAAAATVGGRAAAAVPSATHLVIHTFLGSRCTDLASLRDSQKFTVASS